MMQTLLLAAMLIAGAQIYTWVDETGQRHYSDRPVPGSEPLDMEVQRAPRDPSPMAVPEARRPVTREAPPPERAVRYERVAILSPEPEQVLWNIGGELEVTTEVRPELQEGHRLRIYLDGDTAATLEPGTTRTRLSEVWRGARTLRAEVVDSNGQSLGRSPTIEFYVQQTSIANPENPLRQDGTLPPP